MYYAQPDNRRAPTHEAVYPFEFSPKTTKLVQSPPPAVLPYGGYISTPQGSDARCASGKIYVKSGQYGHRFMLHPYLLNRAYALYFEADTECVTKSLWVAVHAVDEANGTISTDPIQIMETYKKKQTLSMTAFGRQPQGGESHRRIRCESNPTSLYTDATSCS